VSAYGFTVTEHDGDRPWIVRDREHQHVELEDGVEFFAWGALSRSAVYTERICERILGCAR
jgi:hypothetical protein